MKPLVIALFFEVGHPYYGQLTPVKIKYPLRSSTWPYCGLKFRAHYDPMLFIFFEVDCWPSVCWFSIVSRAHYMRARLPCCKQNWVVQKATGNDNSELKVNRSMHFSFKSEPQLIHLYIQKTSLESWKTQTKYLAHPSLGGPLLG